MSRKKRLTSLITIMTGHFGGVGVIAVFQEFATSVEQMDEKLEYWGM